LALLERERENIKAREQRQASERILSTLLTALYPLWLDGKQPGRLHEIQTPTGASCAFSATRAESGLINYGRREFFTAPERRFLSLMTTNSPPQNHLKMASSQKASFCLSGAAQG